MIMALKKKQEADTRLKQFPDSDIVAILDTDWCAYGISSVGDEDYIEVGHSSSDKVLEFAGVSKFKGLGKQWMCPDKRDELPDDEKSWLEKRNFKLKSKGKKPLTPDDFTIEHKKRRKKEYEYKTVKRTEYDKGDFSEWTIIEEDSKGVRLERQLTDDEALVRIFYSAKQTITKALAELGTHKYESYLGKGGDYREHLSTLIKYKGERDNKPKPLVMPDVVDYLERSFNSQVVRHIENDDAVVMRAYGDPNAVIVGEDKDFYGQPVKFFNANRPEEGIIDGDCFGKLWIVETVKRVNGKDIITKKVRGYGRIFLYWQILAGDSTDCYKMSCMSDTKFGDISAYNALVDCKDDKEALESVIEVAKMLYPEPKVVKSWRGHEMLIDWLYVAREQFRMATMLRWEGDSRTLDTEFAKYGVIYEYSK